MIRLVLMICLIHLPSVVHAQLGFIDGIFKNVEDVGAYFSLGSLNSRSNLEAEKLRGFGIEVSFGIDGFGCVSTSKARCGEKKPATRKLTDGEITIHGNDTTRKYKEVEVPPSEPADLLSFSIALGYAQVTGFEGQGASPRITGTLEELPFIAAYASLYPSKAVTPYVGVRAGLATLSGFRGYVSDSTLHTASGKTYLLGLVGGVAVGVSGAMLFAEANHTYTTFPSVEWSAINNLVPTALPRELRLSRTMLNVGIQVTFKK